MSGALGSRSLMPSAVSASSADSNVIWLDIADPARISSAVRSDTSVTSYPSLSSPCASAVPAGPAPTTAIRRGPSLMRHSLSPAATGPGRTSCRDRGKNGPPRAGGGIDQTQMLDAVELSIVDPGEPGREASAARNRYGVVLAAVHDDHLTARSLTQPGRRVGGVVPFRHLLGSATEQLQRGPTAEGVLGRAPEVAHRSEGDHPVLRRILVRQPQHDLAARRVPQQRGRAGHDPQT